MEVLIRDEPLRESALKDTTEDEDSGSKQPTQQSPETSSDDDIYKTAELRMLNHLPEKTANLFDVNLFISSDEDSDD